MTIINGDLREKMAKLSMRDDELTSMLARVEAKMTEVNVILLDKISTISSELQTISLQNETITERAQAFLNQQTKQTEINKQFVRKDELEEFDKKINDTFAKIDKVNMIVSKANSLIVLFLIGLCFLIFHVLGIV